MYKINCFEVNLGIPYLQLNKKKTKKSKQLHQIFRCFSFAKLNSLLFFFLFISNIECEHILILRYDSLRLLNCPNDGKAACSE